MSVEPARSPSLPHITWLTATLLSLACDPSFDTRWRRPDPPPMVDAAGMDAEPSLPDAAPPPPDVIVIDAGDADTPSGPLPRVDCSAVMRDAGLDASCELDCFAACFVWCRDGGALCGDAEAWMPCAQCSDAGPVPTL